MTDGQDRNQPQRAGNRLDQQIRLADGRKLGFTEYGAAEGKPVFYFHGFPGSRISWPGFDSGDGASHHNLRIIAVDRPGYGLSDPQRDRTLLAWADDVVALADAMKLDRFGVLGVSGGGPYASVCAYKLTERISAAAIVCGMGPADAPGSKEGASWTYPGKPALLRRGLLMMSSMAVHKSPDKFVEQMQGAVSAPDRALLEAHPDLATLVVEDWKEAFRQGVGATQQEAGLFARPWGFDLHEIQAAVRLWHGEEDNNVLGSVGHYVADAIPNCQATFYANEGHFSIIYNQMDEILAALAA